MCQALVTSRTVRTPSAFNMAALNAAFSHVSAERSSTQRTGTPCSSLAAVAIVAASDGVARIGGTLEEALRAVPKDGPPARVLICGSLYLAGEALKRDAA